MRDNRNYHTLDVTCSEETQPETPSRINERNRGSASFDTVTVGKGNVLDRRVCPDCIPKCSQDGACIRLGGDRQRYFGMRSDGHAESSGPRK